jgi:molybdenum cofactor guanylyltransferase
MNSAGFVLAGGRSSRMGRDKALLPYGGRTLVEHIATVVREAAGSVTLIGPPPRYEALGLPVIADMVHECGPLGGILTALTVSTAPWNLVVACDMPSLTAESLRTLLAVTGVSDCDCVVPRSPSGRLEPLAAVYHRACLPVFRRAILEDRRKLTDLLAELRMISPLIPEGKWLENVNTPSEWITHASAPRPDLFSPDQAHG